MRSHERLRVVRPEDDPVKRTPLKPMSAKKRAKQAKRRIVVLRVMQRDGSCRFRASVDASREPWEYADFTCAGPLDVHEIIPRSAWRDGDLEVDNCVLLCRRHHDWVGDHPTEAHELGLHGYSWERP